MHLNYRSAHTYTIRYDTILYYTILYYTILYLPSSCHVVVPMSSCLPGHSLALTSLSFSFQLSPVIKYRLNELNALNVCFQSPLIPVLSFSRSLVLRMFVRSFLFLFCPFPPPINPTPVPVFHGPRFPILFYLNLFYRPPPPLVPLSPRSPILFRLTLLPISSLRWVGGVALGHQGEARRGEAKFVSLQFLFLFFVFVFVSRCSVLV